MPNVDLLGVLPLWYRLDAARSHLVLSAAIREGVATWRRPVQRAAGEREHGATLRPRINPQHGRSVCLRYVSRGRDGAWPSVAAVAAAGMFWVAASFGINYLFEGKGVTHWLINGGYHAQQFTRSG